MPWINQEMCTGCQICVDECSVGAIVMDEGLAMIDESSSWPMNIMRMTERGKVSFLNV
jgi:ferredoxin